MLCSVSQAECFMISNNILCWVFQKGEYCQVEPRKSCVFKILMKLPMSNCLICKIILSIFYQVPRSNLSLTKLGLLAKERINIMI